MEVLLRSEMFFQNQKFHTKVRTALIHCTNCIVSQCYTGEMEPCVKFCMKPCTRLKIYYETQRLDLLSKLKEEFIECSNQEDLAECQYLLVEKYNRLLTSLFESF